MELEKNIQRAICEYLTIKKVFFWRQNTSPIFNKERGTYRSMPQYSLNGVSDLLALKDGVFYGLEIKRPGGKLREAQEAFRDAVIHNGGRFEVLTSVDDAIKLFP